mgnify:CR=1 FL=1
MSGSPEHTLTTVAPPLRPIRCCSICPTSWSARGCSPAAIATATARRSPQAVAESARSADRAHMPWVKEWDEPNQGAIFVRRCSGEMGGARGSHARTVGRATGTFVGSSGLHRIDWSVPNVEIGYWIRTRFEGRGFVTEATALIAAFAFDTLQAQRVRIRCDAENARSAAVPRRLGLRPRGDIAQRTACERREVARHVRVRPDAGRFPRGCAPGRGARFLST